MVCPACGSTNIATARFCDQCATPLPSTCLSCGRVNRPSARFCAGCSASLEALPIESLAPGDGDPTPLNAERRHLTVLFCDLISSTELSANLDPEDWREIVTSYHNYATETVTRFGGHVALYIGDGLMVFFGYPLANEEDPQRAVLAGLALLDAIAALNQKIDERYGCKLTVRVGVHCGPVVVSDGSARRANVFGTVPNIASHVEATAPPNTVLITGAVHRLISGMFVVEDLGSRPIKGVDRPIQLYRVIQPTGARGRLAASAAIGLTPFVGRGDELRLLRNRWDRARAGEGQAVLIVGEPGIGKSRLLRRFREELTDIPHIWVECASASLHQNTPFYAIEEMLRQSLRFTADLKPEERLSFLEASLELAGLNPIEAVPLVSPLVSFPLPPKYPPPQLEPGQRRNRLLATITAWALGIAKIQPMVIASEDLHWADPSTLEVNQLLAEQCATSSLLMICTARPEFHPKWSSRAHHTHLTLNRLTADDTREMVNGLTPVAKLNPATTRALVRRSGGVPLFVEQLTRSVLENGDDDSVVHAIPATLHDSLMARLDRLGPAREIAQIASVIGHEFSWETLRVVADVPDEKLANSLKTLADAQLLFERGTPPQAVYTFRHALIGDAAYQSLLRSKRQTYHRRIAKFREERSSDQPNAEPQVLAHHYTEAGDLVLAIPQWQLAGQMAIQRSANTEAVNHLTKALELLKTLPQTTSRSQQELALQITLSVPLMHTKGYASHELEAVYSRARELSNEVGESPQFFPMRFGMWMFYSLRAQYKTARELTEQLVTVAESTRDPGLLIEAHTARGVTLSFLGELLTARRHLEQAISLYEPERFSSHAYVYAQDPGVHSLSYATLVLWLLGYPDQAREHSSKALTLAQGLSHPFSLAFAIIHVLYIHRFSYEVKLAEQRAQELLTLSIEHDFPITLAVGAAHLGWALAEQNRGEEGITLIRQAIDTWRATGSSLFFQPFLLAILAEAYGKTGLPEDGLAELAEALDIVNKTGERYWHAELYRLKGELTLQAQFQNSHFTVRDDAEACFRSAIDVAQRQSAKSLELRSVISLSRLWWNRGKKAQARQMLMEVYGWFSEGFDTADLHAARTLLQEAH
jgi:class 3 adenylate cyclase/tetratricopeptide (TPR) repeat protein